MSGLEFFILFLFHFISFVPDRSFYLSAPGGPSPSLTRISLLPILIRHPPTRPILIPPLPNARYPPLPTLISIPKIHINPNTPSPLPLLGSLPAPTAGGPKSSAVAAAAASGEADEDGMAMDQEREAVRKAALEFMISLSEPKSAMVRKIDGWTAAIVRGVLWKGWESSQMIISMYGWKLMYVAPFMESCFILSLYSLPRTQWTTRIRMCTSS